jgi:hypothetical protein
VTALIPFRYGFEHPIPGACTSPFSDLLQALWSSGRCVCSLRYLEGTIAQPVAINARWLCYRNCRARAAGQGRCKALPQIRPHEWL